MKNRKLLALALLVAASAYVTFDLTGASAPAAQDDAAMMGPGPEHKLLEKYVGTWDVEMEISMVPDAPPEKNKGKMTEKLVCGGMWLASDYESTLMGAPFMGHTVMGYDTFSKKYVSTWVDSMSPYLTIGEGTFDEKTKTHTMTLKGRDPTGQPSTSRTVEVWKDADTRDWTMYSPGPDGKEYAGIHIVYRRKK